jgi:cAMP-dependent protein kinase regulator
MNLEQPETYIKTEEERQQILSSLSKQFLTQNMDSSA